MTLRVMYEQYLTQAGLSPSQAALYEAMLKTGPAAAGKIAKITPLKRGLVYKLLDELVSLGLAIKKDAPGKVAVFEPAHPGKLKELAEQKEAQAKTAQTALSAALGALVSDYNLAFGKPGVKFYEGVEGFRQITADSLTAKDKIRSYIDNEAVNKYVPKENQEYVRKRLRLKLKKRMLALDTPYVRERAKSFDTEVTDIRVLDIRPFPFETVMQIYDDKISYLTLKPEAMFGVIIEDERIARMHKYFFDYAWERALPVMPVAKNKPGPANEKIGAGAAKKPVAPDARPTPAPALAPRPDEQQISAK